MKRISLGNRLTPYLLLTCLVLAAFVPGDSMLRALVLVAIGLVLMVIRARKAPPQ